MGYELSVSRSLDERVDPLWYCCGWDKVEMFNSLCCMGETKTQHMKSEFGDEYDLTYGVVPLSSLMFVTEIERRLESSALWSRYRRVYDADEVLSEEWYTSLPADSRVDMALDFFEGFDYRGADREVARMLYQASCEMYPYFVKGFAEAIAHASEEGLSEVIVTG